MQVLDPMAYLDEQIAKASAPRSASNKRPIFLYFKENHKALIRPLTDLRGCVILQKHDKFNADPQLKVSAICAHENGQDCLHCQNAANDKKLSAGARWYLPVYVYKVVDSATNQPVTYKEKDESGNETEKPVAGVRLLELSIYGTISIVLKWFREYMKDEDSCAMSECDFVIAQTGSGQGKSFTVMPKSPKPMEPRIKQIIPTSDAIRARILEALPPLQLEVEKQFNMPGKNIVGDPAITSFVQGVKNAQEADDVIREF